jgi:CBS domain-containing protein
MTSDPVTVDVDDGVADVCRTMREHGVRRVPVTDGGALAGIVTMDDVLVLLGREMDDLTSVVEAESPPYTAA